MMSIHSSMVFITVHFSVCFQSVVLTSIVHHILYQRRNKSIHSLLSKMKFSRFLCENHLISHAKRQRFFCGFAFFLILVGLAVASLFTLCEDCLLFVVVLVLAREAVDILESFSSTKLYSKRRKCGVE